MNDEHKTIDENLPTITEHTSNSTHEWPTPTELTNLTISQFLDIVARNACLCVFAELCQVFMYDKGTSTLHLEASSSGEVKELSFRPTKGIVSASFLQRRCFRVQGSEMHRALYAEYDIPNRMRVESLLVVPILLHHRVVGVIELINYVDPQSQDSSLDPFSEEESEVSFQLNNAPCVEQRFAFIAKDEQTMLQFTSHVAQLLDTKLKQMTQPKTRDDPGNKAIDLLNMMNNKIEQGASFKMAPRSVVHSSNEKTQEPQVELFKEPVPQKRRISTADMSKLTKGICRIQACFRGHYLRRIYHLSEMLQENRVLSRSATIVQRAVRRYSARQRIKRRKMAVHMIDLGTQFSTEKDHQPTNELNKVVSSQKQPKCRQFSATVIQRNFRGHKERLTVKRLTGFTNAAKGYRNIVKLQSFVRGSIVRKKVERMLKIKRQERKPAVVCMRLASDTDVVNSSSSPSASTSTCIYPMPPSSMGQANKRHLLRRDRIEEVDEQSVDAFVTQKRNTPVPRHYVHLKGASNQIEEGTLSSLTMVSSRRLIASPRRVNTEPHDRISQPQPISRDTPQTAEYRKKMVRAFPNVVFEPSRQRRERPAPGVQFVETWMLSKEQKVKIGEITQKSSELRSPEKDSFQASTFALPRFKVAHNSNLQVCLLPAKTTMIESTARRTSTIQNTTIDRKIDPLRRSSVIQDTISSVDQLRRSSVIQDTTSSIYPLRRSSVIQDTTASIDPIRRSSVNQNTPASIDPLRRSSVNQDTTVPIDPIRRSSVIQDTTTLIEQSRRVSFLDCP